MIKRQFTAGIRRALLLGVFLATATAAGAAQYGWTGAGDGSGWGDSNNWGGVSFPQLGDSAVFGNGDKPTINLGTNREVTSVIIADGGGIAAAVSFDNQATSRTLRVANLLRVGRGDNNSTTYGTLDIGVDTAITVQGSAEMGSYRKCVGTVNVSGGTLDIGSSNVWSSSMIVGYTASTLGGATPAIGYLNVADGVFSAYVTNLYVGCMDYPGTLDLTSWNPRGRIAITGGDVSLHSRRMLLGWPVGANGMVRSYGTIDAGAATGTVLLECGDLLMGYSAEDASSSGIVLGNSSNASLQRLTVTNNLVMGYFRNATADLKVRPGASLFLGSPEQSINVELGHQGSALNYQAVGRLTITGDELQAYIGVLTLGYQGGTGSSIANRGRGTLDASTVVLGKNGNVLDVNTALVGYAGSASYYRDGGLLLGEGVARIGQLVAGRGANGTADIDLNGTIVQTTNVTINGGADVDVIVSGDPAGFDLTETNATLSVTGNGNITVTFEPRSPGFLGTYWGLRWAGNHTNELYAMLGSGLTIVDNTAEDVPVDILYWGNSTYIGLPAITPTNGLFLEVR